MGIRFAKECIVYISLDNFSEKKPINEYKYCL